jgi:regulator of protease activity HflC (stomatin/prohibitin superfamily)
VILSAAEAEIAHKFAEAAATYANNPAALHLRGMNMLYESVKERGSTIIVPSSAVDSMNLGGLAGLTALAKSGAAAAPEPPPSPRATPNG